MNIRDFSELTGMSPHTIRYYEKIGIFRKINRNNGGHRFFTSNDVAWAGFIKRLKDTGMSLKRILEYANLREEGEHTAGDRMEILEKHADVLEKKISVYKQNLKKLREKIIYYEELEKNLDLE
jgi:DNA-binding transcriptional MerR regulator